MGHTGRSERTPRLVAGAAVLFAGLSLSTSTPNVGARPSVVLAQADELSVERAAMAVGDVVGSHPSVSGDGRFVVFQGAPVVPEGAVDDRLSTIFLTDRESGETTELTPVPEGLRSGDSLFPVISGDGCSVATVTEMALDVFRDDDQDQRWDIYRSTLPHCGGAVGTWDLVSTRSGSGGLARDDVAVAPPTLSRGGTLLAYTHHADHLYEAGGITTISLVDLEVPIDDPGRSRLVAGSPADSPNDTFVHAGLDQPVLSGNGEHLAYRSDATSAEAVPGWAPGDVDGGSATAQVFSWRIAEPDPFVAVQLISALPDGTPAPGGASDPDISRDGTSIAFVSSSQDLAPAVYPTCSTDCPSQVFIVNRDSDRDGNVGTNDVPVTQLLSVENDSDPAVAGTSPSSQPAISGDGQLVAFVTKAPNLQLIQVPGVGRGDDGDLLLAEVRLGRLSRLSNVDGEIVPTQGVHAHPDVSDSGRTTVYDSSAANALLPDGAVQGRQIVAQSSNPLLSLPDADLGTTLVGVKGDEWYVAVINDGPSSFRPTSVTMTNSQFQINEETSSCLFASSVPAGGSCTVALSYTPSAAGGTSGTLTVAEEGFGAVEVSSTVAGAGGEPALRIDPAGADLGLVTVGEPSTEFQFDLRNVAFVPTEITSFEITGEHAAEFEFTTNLCAFRPLNPRAACSVGITFTPTDAGRRTALVQLATRSGQYTTMLVSGDGEYEPVVTIDTDSVEAGADLFASGSQYPPNTELTVVFGDEPNSSISVVTDETGSFAVLVPVDQNERGGERTIVVQSSSGAAASAPVEVVPVDDQAYIGLPGFGLG